MNILIAVDSFKGSLSSKEISNVIEKSILDTLPNSKIKKIPIADGGEGTIESLIEGLNGKIIHKKVHGPLMEDVNGYYGILPESKTAIIEMAICSGLPLVPSKLRNPLSTTTYGVGELILDALDKGCNEFIVGIGGSATNDAGIGMCSALGFRFLDEFNNELSPIGENLIKVHHIDISEVDSRIKNTKFLIACDVDNPLFGKLGAAYTYGPQKGANPSQVKALDNGLKHFSRIVKNILNIDKANLPGAGAAGGLGYGFSVFLNGELKPGIDIVFEKINFNENLKDIDLIITGEGKIDFQSLMGKAISGVAKAAKAKNIPVIAIGGCVTNDAYKLYDYGITSIFSITNKPMSIEEAMDSENTKLAIYHTIKAIFKLK
ncbi:glycerate kinase [Candidatus Izemoplasma sp. B36]|uniref:glycerate kinase family protein n=1 Tax=Candidatus Izemoplasma sp. B36 TaxID=3242468 RepID=UPI0035588C3C